MTRARLPVVVALLFAGAIAHVQEVPLEYQVKAAYLYNFVKFVEWQGRGAAGPLSICVAGHNPFGEVLADTVRGESINGRTIETRVILEPDPSCRVVFIPDGAAAATYLRSARGTSTLTVGESRDFIAQGGIIRFIVDEGNVRFEIDADAAERAEIKISSRLLRLARVPDRRGGR